MAAQPLWNGCSHSATCSWKGAASGGLHPPPSQGCASVCLNYTQPLHLGRRDAFLIVFMPKEAAPHDGDNLTRLSLQKTVSFLRQAHKSTARRTSGNARPGSRLLAPSAGSSQRPPLFLRDQRSPRAPAGVTRKHAATWRVLGCPRVTAGRCLEARHLLRYKNNSFVQTQEDAQPGLCRPLSGRRTSCPSGFWGEREHSVGGTRRGSQKANRNEGLFWGLSLCQARR